MAIAKLFKVNKLGPLGLLAAIGCFVGIFLPWKQTQHGLINGTLEPLGWIMAILIVLYILLLFANFKWNILLGIALLIMSIYEWVLIKGELAGDPTASLGYGLYVIMICSLVMCLSKLLLFRKKKSTSPPPIQSGDNATS
jgi:hypothetical protein